MSTAKKFQTQPLRVGMIGGGVNSAVGRVHEIAMKMDNLYVLQAGCFSRQQAINQQSAQEYAVPKERVYSCAEELLIREKGQLDAIVIATPIQQHAEHLHQALDHGYRVISDKPLLSNSLESQALLQRVQPDTTEVFSIFNYTGYPAVREMKRRIAEGQIGQVFKVMAEMPQDSYLRLKNQDRTQAIQRWRLEDGIVACVTLDLFVHLHSLVYFLTQRTPQKVTAQSRSISEVAQGLIDEVDALINYDDNLMVNAWYGKAALGYRNGLKIRVLGTKGSLQWVQEDSERLIHADEYGDLHIIDRISLSSSVTTENRYNRFKAGHPSGFIEAFANYYADIAQAIAENQLNPYTISTGIAAQGLALCEAITLSSKTGQSIFLN